MDPRKKQQLLDKINTNDSTITSISFYDNMIYNHAKDEFDYVEKQDRLDIIDALINAKNTQIVALAFAGNAFAENKEIGDDEAIQIAKLLKQKDALPNLQRLRFIGCNVSASGAKAIAEGLKEKNLESLDFAFNNLQDQGAQALAQALVTHPTITFFDICSNNISENALKEFLKTVEKNSTLTTLGVGHNLQDENAQAALNNQVKVLMNRNALAAQNSAPNSGTVRTISDGFVNSNSGNTSVALNNESGLQTRRDTKFRNLKVTI